MMGPRETIAKARYYWDVREHLAHGVMPFDMIPNSTRLRYFDEADHLLNEFAVMTESEFQQMTDQVVTLRMELRMATQ
jgi:hypothetical protein